MKDFADVVMTQTTISCNWIMRLPPCSYLTLAAPHTATIEIKKSKFITTAWSTASPEEVSVGCMPHTCDSSAARCGRTYMIG